MSGEVQRPAPVLRIGVVGHTRDLPVDQLRATIVSVLETIEKEAKTETIAAGGAYASTTCRFGLVCCLAPGTDQLVAELARGRGYTLTGVIPSNRERYRKRLGGHGLDAVAKFDRLLDAQPPPAVVELAQAALGKKAADREATRLVEDHCDLVIAIWCGAQANQECCTTEGVRAALHRGLPVVHVDPRTPSQWSVLSERRLGWEAMSSDEQLSSCVRAILADPFRSDESAGTAPKDRSRTKFWLRPPNLYGVSDQKRAEHIRRDQRTRRARFYGEPEPQPSGGFSGLWDRWFYGPARREQRRQKEEFENSVAARTAREESPHTKSGASRSHAASEISERIRNAFVRHFDAADTRAVRYMECYRSAFAAAYMLGGLAVLLAVLAFVRFGVAEWLAYVFAGAELLTVWAIWRIYRRARREQWHVRAVDYRLLAEMFRHAKQLALVGGILPEARLPEHWRGGPHRGLWVYWYYRAVVREVDFGLRGSAQSAGGTLVIDDDYMESSRSAFDSNWIGDQAEYHAGTSRRYALLEWRLERACLLLFAIVAASCLVHLILPIVPIVMDACGWSSENGTHSGSINWHTILNVALLCIGAAAPAFAAALHAISTQAETSRLAESYERMEAMLKEALGRLSRLPRPVSLDALTAVAYEAAEVMLAEVEDWQTAYRFHAVTTV